MILQMGLTTSNLRPGWDGPMIHPPLFELSVEAVIPLSRDSLSPSLNSHREQTVPFEGTGHEDAMPVSFFRFSEEFQAYRWSSNDRWNNTFVWKGHRADSQNFLRHEFQGKIVRFSKSSKM
jgi:hypothetical protein